jgi:hypothetical protein
MNNLQALMDGMSAQWQRERAETQMTLGKMIDALKILPQDMLMDGVGRLHSYRGYYSDLAFELTNDKVKVSDVLAMCLKAMGKVFVGYKGGDFVMGELTPLWIAEYGCCGRKLMAINSNGSLETAEDD